MIIRKVIFTHFEFKEYYEYSPYFKVYRAPDNFKRPGSTIGHYPVILEFNFEEIKGKKGYTNFSYSLDSKNPIEDIKNNCGLPDKIDDDLANDHLIYEKFLEYFYLLNALTNNTFIFYGYEQKWGISVFESKVENSAEWFQAGYFTPRDFKWKEDGKIKFNDYYDFGFYPVLCTFDENNFPRNEVYLKDIFDVYFNLKDKWKKKIYNTFILFSKALKIKSIDKSIYLVSLASCIEGLMEIEKDLLKIKLNRCSCGGTIYKTTNRFKDFLKKYGLLYIEEEILNNFYTYRCDIAHRGVLLSLSNQTFKFFIEDEKDIKRKNEEFTEDRMCDNYEKIVKTCFKTFLFFNKDILCKK
ncbi:MAG: hypothetical protein PHH06_03410 [Candidatus Gracilibacteria bacterium]|nr:hypothetical protein [Candidatus Gracilibacteria bacterium]